MLMVITVDQAGCGAFVFVGSSGSDALMWPLAALRALASYGEGLAALSAPVFRPNQHSDQALSRTTLACRLTRRLRSPGVAHALFGLHSFRIGGATAAAVAGLPERVVKVHGRAGNRMWCASKRAKTSTSAGISPGRWCLRPDGCNFLCFNCTYHQHLLDYCTGSLPQIQRSVGRGTPNSPTYVEYLPLHLD